MRIVKSIFAVALMGGWGSAISQAADLQAATLASWNAYMDEVNVHLEQRVAGENFLWADESEDRARRVRRGEIVVAPVLANGTKPVANGLIHHWIGAIFISGATLESLAAIVHDYDDYEKIYRPAVTSSKTLACSEDGQEFQMVWQRKVMFVSAAMEGRYREHDVRIDSRRGYTVADATEMRQIENFGHAGERLLPRDTGSGYIWRIRSVARYEERDGGVVLEMEAMALTRGIPGSLSWLVTPVVNHLSVNSLALTLRETRDAVVHTGGRTVWASCPNPARRVALAKAGGGE